jgi:hypothetical protein
MRCQQSARNTDNSLRVRRRAGTHRRPSARLPASHPPTEVLVRLIGLAVVLAVSLFAAPLAVEAQQTGKVYRVGVLTNKASDPAEVRLWQAFRSGLRERGWIEGQNILLEFRATEGNTARLPELGPTWFGSRWT